MILYDWSFRCCFAVMNKFLGCVRNFNLTLQLPSLCIWIPIWEFTVTASPRASRSVLPKLTLVDDKFGFHGDGGMIERNRNFMFLSMTWDKQKLPWNRIKLTPFGLENVAYRRGLADSSLSKIVHNHCESHKVEHENQNQGEQQIALRRPKAFFIHILIICHINALMHQTSRSHQASHGIACTRGRMRQSVFKNTFSGRFSSCCASWKLSAVLFRPFSPSCAREKFIWHGLRGNFRAVRAFRSAPRYMMNCKHCSLFCVYFKIEKRILEARVAQHSLLLPSRWVLWRLGDFQFHSGWYIVLPRERNLSLIFVESFLSCFSTLKPQKD